MTFKSMHRAAWFAAALMSAPAAALAAPQSTLTLPSTTTAYTAGQFMANSATGASVVVPSFNVTNQLSNESIISRLRLSTNDTTASSWNAQTVQLDLWLAAPTFTNGDRSAFSPLTGTGGHIGAFTCTFSAIYGDGAYAECAPAVGNFASIKVPSNTRVYWTAIATTGSGTTGVSKVLTLTPETVN